jgi:hypothetical protein
MLVRCLGREMYATNDGAPPRISTPVSEVAVEFADDQAIAQLRYFVEECAFCGF